MSNDYSPGPRGFAQHLAEEDYGWPAQNAVRSRDQLVVQLHGRFACLS